MVRADLGQEEAAAELIAELVLPRRPGKPVLPGAAPAMTRTALSIGQLKLARRLPRDLPRHPYARVALLATSAALREADGDAQDAADAYISAADRWERLRVVPELAFALLGEGRCLLSLSRPRGRICAATRPGDLRATPGGPFLETTDLLLHQAIALDS